MRFLSVAATACLCLAPVALAACHNEIEVSREADASDAPQVGASPEVQRLVAEIDSMLVVPQDEYPNGTELSGVFDALLEAVTAQQHSLRTTQVAQNMGYFITRGVQIGWNPQEKDVARLAKDWREFRGDVLAGP